MVFEGYLSLNGREIVNAARTGAYVRNLAAAMAPKDCYDCDEGLTEAVGDTEYTTPQGDGAPWYDPSDPETAGFYGFYPLAFDGATDSTRTIELVDQVGDGDVILGARHGGRDIRVSGFAFAEDVCSLEAGRTWLDNALRGGDDCFGDEAKVFACCPTPLDPDIDYSNPVLPIEPPTEVCRQNLAHNPRSNAASTTGLATPVLRTNYALSPRFSNTSRFAPGAGGSYTLTASDIDGPLGIGFLRAEATADDTDEPQSYLLNDPGVDGAPVVAGDEVTVSLWVRTSTAGVAPQIEMIWAIADGSPLTTEVAPLGAIPVDTWVRVDQTFVAPATAAFGQAVAEFTGLPLTGDSIDFANSLVEVVGTVEPYFDGDYDGDPPEWGHWTGAVDGSVSVMTTEGVSYPTSDAPLMQDGGVNDGTDNHAHIRKAIVNCTGSSCNTVVAVIPLDDDASDDTYWNATDSNGLYFQPDRTYRVSADFILVADHAATSVRARRIAVITDPGGVEAITFQSDQAPATEGTHRLSLTFATASDITNSYLRFYNGSADPAQAVYWDRVLVEDITDGLPETDAYFDGSTSDDDDYVYEWDGEVDASTSTAYCAPDLSADLAAWNTTSGTITQDGTSIVIDWENDDPCMIAWREITGLAPGAQYQLRTYLESMDYHVRIGPEAPDSCRMNLAPDPKATGWGVSTTAGSSDTSNAFISFEPGGPLGTGFRQVIYTQPSDGGYLLVRDGSDGQIPVTFGQSYVVSGYMLRAFEGQTGRVGAFLRDFDGVFISTIESAPFVLEDGWDRHGIRIDVPVGDTWSIEPFFRFDTPESIPANSRIGLANVLVEPSSSTETQFSPWFDGDTEGFRWTGEPDSSASEVSVRVDAETISGLSLSRNLLPPEDQIPFEPTVLDFSPVTGSRFLWITPTSLSRASAGGGEGADYSVTIERLVVRKTARPGVILFGTGDDMTPVSDGWTHQPQEGFFVSWEPEGPGESPILVTQADNFSGADLNYMADDGPSRTVFGLRPGSRYRVAIEVSLVGPDGSVPIELAVLSGGIAQVETYREDSTTTVYIVVEFTAVDSSALIALTPQDAFAPIVVANAEDVIWFLNEWMVEEILETDTDDPDPAALDRRTLYDVKASTGPVLTNIRKTSCGVMGEVTFGIHSGDPYFYRDPRFVGGLPSGSRETVPERGCTDEGQPVELNYAYNPSVESNLTGWTANGPGAVIVRQASSATQAGDFYAFASAPNSPGNRLDDVLIEWVAPTTGPLPFEGQVLTIALGAFATSVEWEGEYRINYSVSSTGGVASGQRTVNIVNDQWWIFWRRIEVPPGDIQSIVVRLITPDSIAQGGGLGVDGLAIMDGSYVPYTDENGILHSIQWDETYTGAEWTGDVGNSALRFVPPEVNEAVDPECPPIPLPPQPPVIPNSCVEEAGSWDRTVFEISEDEVPVALTAFPVVTITTGAVAVRQARVRFWPNPDDLRFDQIAPCDFEGDIVVSYIPPNATLVIDGVRQTATLTTSGGEEQVATHLLYSTDGGPVEWPEITGGVSHYVTLDTDVAGDFAGASMTVHLVIRD